MIVSMFMWQKANQESKVGHPHLNYCDCEKQLNCSIANVQYVTY